MRINNTPLDLKVSCMFTQKSWCHVAFWDSAYKIYWDCKKNTGWIFINL